MATTTYPTPKINVVKGAAKSKTMWFALALEIFALIQFNLPEVSDQLGPYYGWIMMGVGITVSVLRVVTTKPLAQK